MEELIKDKVNVWDVIDTYFRDEPYYKSQHQVDSFNEFIFSEDNGIQNIIRRENPFIVHQGDKGGNNISFKYEISFYFGETLDETKESPNHGEPINDMENIFKKCLNQLKINKVEGLLIHNQNTWGNNNTKFFAEKLIKSKKINHIGVSIYDQKFIPEDSLASIIQVPGNIFNYKLLTSKKLERFINKGGEVHVRSVFIQGLLLMSPHKIPDYFAKLIKPLKEFHNLCKKNDVNPITLSTGCIFKLIPQCKLVIGIDSIEQLDKIINKTKIQVSDNIVNEALKIGKQYSSNLWDPRNWS